MRKAWLLSFALVGLLAFAGRNPAAAVSADPNPLSAGVSRSDVQLARVVVGPRGGVAMRGPRGGAYVHGPGRGFAVRGAYRVGGRYYGGIWYGRGRRFWNGRWWPYGVGSCWLLTPIGYVWTCGP